MKCKRHNLDLGEGIKQKICGNCLIELRGNLDKTLKEIGEKQKIHWDSPLCMCKACNKQ